MTEAVQISAVVQELEEIEKTYCLACGSTVTLTDSYENNSIMADVDYKQFKMFFSCDAEPHHGFVKTLNIY